MAFTVPSVADIQNRIKADLQSRLTSNISIPERSLLNILTIVFAGAIRLAYGSIAYFSRQIFPDTAEGLYLDRQANLRGLTRKAATFASGQITATGTDSTVIPINTQFRDDNNNIYLTQASATITSGSAIITVNSQLAGLAYNTTSTNLTLVNPISGINNTASVSSTIQGGTDQETDAQLQARLITFLQSSPSSGRDEDYIRWATEISGVDVAWIYPIYSGPGTVSIAIADVNRNPVSSLLKTTVQTAIDAQKPIGVIATVQDPVIKNITFDISIKPNTTANQTNINNALTSLFKAEARPGGTLLLSHIQSAIITTGIEDFTITDIKKDAVSIGVVNISLTGFELAKFNGATYATLS